MRSIFFSFLLILNACHSPLVDNYSFSYGTWQNFSARGDDDNLTKPFIYRAFVPFKWHRMDPDENVSLSDTRVPLCQFLISDDEESAVLSIHTFPFQNENFRIACLANVSRWKKQFDELNSISTIVTPVSHSGFVGLKLEAKGIFSNQEQIMLAWTMQIASQHIDTIQMTYLNDQKNLLADYTIKIVGPVKLIKKHKAEIEKFATSFELICGLATEL